MPQHWPGTVILAIVTAAVTTLLVERFIKPRIERRNHLRGIAFESRDRLSSSMLVILSTSARLKEPMPTGLSPTLQQAVRADWQRWYDQMDEATQYMIDNIHTYLLTYVGLGGFRDQLVRYVNDSRAIMLSERSRTRKAELLSAMTGPAWDMFFGTRIWNVRAVVALPSRRAELSRLLDEAENGGPTTEPSA